MEIMDQLRDVIKSQHSGRDYIDWSLPIVVTSSAAGYYIGMVERDGTPHARFSCEYWENEEDAIEALRNACFTAKLWL